VLSASTAVRYLQTNNAWIPNPKKTNGHGKKNEKNRGGGRGGGGPYQRLSL